MEESPGIEDKLSLLFRYASFPPPDSVVEASRKTYFFLLDFPLMAGMSLANAFFSRSLTPPSPPPPPPPPTSPSNCVFPTCFFFY